MQADGDGLVRVVEGDGQSLGGGGDDGGDAALGALLGGGEGGLGPLGADEDLAVDDGGVVDVDEAEGVLVLGVAGGGTLQEVLGGGLGAILRKVEEGVEGVV